MGDGGFKTAISNSLETKENSDKFSFSDLAGGKFIIHPTRGNGNCLINSVLNGTGLDEELVYLYRKAYSDWCLQNAREQPNLAVVWQNAASQGEGNRWLGDAFIAWCVDNLELRFVIYNEREKTVNVIGDNVGDTLYLHYSGSHYSLMTLR